MKSLLLCAACAVAIASPAVARDHSAYFGLEVGALKVKDTNVRIDGVDAFRIDHKTGIDGDMILGYDFGMFRTEAELAYRRSGHDKYSIGSASVDAEGRTSTHSAMVNGMLDFGNESQVAFFAGAGVGYAQIIHALNDGTSGTAKVKDRGLAWQAIAGARKALTNFFDVGVKYRYFNGGKVSDTVDGDRISTRYKSHSLLASLIYNFNTPEPVAPPVEMIPPAPPPPPPPPATQTCPDGSVVLATDPCPVPPPPPPPPPPTVERG
ncbi:MAG: outer membrane beta-barrel protein [Sphingomicrobium sp.]